MQLTSKTFFGGAVALQFIAAAGFVVVSMVGGVFAGSPSDDHARPPSSSKSQTTDHDKDQEEVPLTCKEAVASGEEPVIYTADQIGWQEKLEDKDFSSTEGDLHAERDASSVEDSEAIDDSDFHAEGSFNGQLIARYSTYFDELGCADEGFAWLVVQYRDEAEFKYLADLKFSYIAEIDEDASGYLAEMDGEEYEPVDVQFEENIAGGRVAVFEVPASAAPSVNITSTLAYSGSLVSSKSVDEELLALVPTTLRYAFTIDQTVRLDSELEGCPSFESRWC